MVIPHLRRRRKSLTGSFRRQPVGVQVFKEDAAVTQRQNISNGGAFEATFGYSRAVRVGDHVHVAGTCAQAPHTTGDAYEQSTSALSIIGKALEEAGAAFTDVVRTVVFVTDMADMEAVARAHSEVFGEIRPA